MKGISVLLARIEGPVNLGFIARAMANTGLKSLSYTGDLPNNHEEALKYAVHADGILSSSLHADSFDQLIKGNDLVIGFSPRSPFSADNLPFEDLNQYITKSLNDGLSVGLLFGNEAHGLSNEELSSCAQIVSLPTSTEYSSMNLAQAVLVALWEIKSIKYDNNLSTIYAERDTLDTILKRLKEYLELIEFFNDQNPDYIWHEIKQIVETKKLTAREAELLLSIVGKSIIRYTYLLNKS